MPNPLPHNPSTTNQQEITNLSTGAGIDRMRLVDSQEAPVVGEELEYRELASNLSRLTKKAQLAGFAPEGTISGLETLVDLSLLAPNPLHPREDWMVQDEEMERLVASIERDGQESPIRVTALWPEDPLALDGYRYLMVDGHRVYRALTLARKSQARILPLHDTGQPYSAYDALRYYLSQVVTRKPLKPYQVLSGFLTLYDQYEVLRQTSDYAMPELSIEKLMANFGITKSTAADVHYLLSNDHTVAQAVARRQLPLKTGYAIIREVPDARRRAQLLSHILEEVNRRAMSDESPITQREVLALVSPTTTSLPAPALSTITTYTASSSGTEQKLQAFARAALALCDAYLALKDLPPTLKGLKPAIALLMDHGDALEALLNG